ncbi:glycoside hydrolase family 19 protein [Flavobacterium sp. ZT3R18]|uniref:glycoside hydrolase family 19 protein n=1 Tax=Flavobacterium sp. ZT3R18 TaxID=2594429 RepID=UPI00117AB213|nr:peptidoglycan-binding protein [Flavobacterium sp. ZT3R18]TRX34943.1 glycoside hydrolase family 19 protein [Flavobacterium sp. ZT3R18]
MLKIKQFQAQYGLLADGVIGKKTLNKLKEVLKIDSNEDLAHFLGQVAHETGNFALDTENLMYSTIGLTTTFKKYFPTPESTVGYVKQPIKIASKVYSNRMGNGDEASQEGWIYKGRGALQLTGKNNYQLFSKYVNDDCVSKPELVAGKYFFESAKFYFDNNNLWKLTKTVDDVSITSVSKKVNGGLNGLNDRITKTKEFYQLLQ